MQQASSKASVMSFELLSGGIFDMFMSRFFKYRLSIFIGLFFITQTQCKTSPSFPDTGETLYQITFSDNKNPPLTLNSYRPQSSYAAKLQDCAYSKTRKTPCLLNELPLIGQVTMRPSREDILARVASSHSWMAQNFEAALNAMPDDLLLYFRAVSAIIISADIRPSRYSPIAGAIYLDAAHLWLKTEEIQDLDKKQDSRAGNTVPFKFVKLWTYTKDNKRASSYSLSGTSNRTVEQIKYSLADLLYHELTHANDMAPPSIWPTLKTNQILFFQIATSAGQYGHMSQALKKLYPLQSSVLYNYAKVAHDPSSENKPTDDQLAMTAKDIGLAFNQDRATDDYAYYGFEDVAMLFGEVMMKMRFNVDRHFAFTSKPDKENPTGDDFIVGFGQKNRIYDPRIKERAKYIAQYLLPEASQDVIQFLNNNTQPEDMTVGDSWLKNLNITPAERTEQIDGSAFGFDFYPVLINKNNLH